MHGTVKTFARGAESGRTLLCAFCPDCGTRLYHEPSYMDGVLNVKPGTLDESSSIKPTVHAWTKHKLPWVVIPRTSSASTSSLSRHRLTGAGVMTVETNGNFHCAGWL